MVLSLVVLLVPVALLVILYRTLFDGDAPVTVDAAPKFQEAQQAKIFPVAVPQGLGADWSTASATFTRAQNGATLRVGYVDPDKDPVQLVESSIAAATLLPSELTKSGDPIGTFRAGNGVWRLFDGRPGEKALVLADQSRTLIVIGKADVDSLQELAGSLS